MFIRSQDNVIYNLDYFKSIFTSKYNSDVYSIYLKPANIEEYYTEVEIYACYNKQLCDDILKCIVDEISKGPNIIDIPEINSWFTEEQL